MYLQLYTGSFLYLSTPTVVRMDARNTHRKLQKYVTKYNFLNRLPKLLKLDLF